MKRLWKLLPSINREVFASLLLIRHASPSYRPPMYQYSLNESLPENTNKTTWEIVTAREGGSYASAMVRALGVLSSDYPVARLLADEDRFKAVEEQFLDEFIWLLSNMTPDRVSLGCLYEYYLKINPLEVSGNSGDFYTPKAVVQSVVRLLQPVKGRIYDPCCGSGSMLIEAAQMVQENEEFELYGQTQDRDSYIICQLHSILNGFNIHLDDEFASALNLDSPFTIKADLILANPPFNARKWCANQPCEQDGKWPYGVPPSSNANFAWLQHIICNLSENGRACVIMPNGSLTSVKYREKNIRAKIIESGIIEAIITFPPGLFYGTKVPFCIWVLNKTRQPKSDVLLIDTQYFEPKIHKKLTQQNIDHLSMLITKFRKGNHISEKGVIRASLKTIAEQDYILSQNLYMRENIAKSLSIIASATEFTASLDLLKRTISNKNLHEHIEGWLEDAEVKCSWNNVGLLTLYDTLDGLNPGRKHDAKASTSECPFVDVKTIIANPILPNALLAKTETTPLERKKFNIRQGDVLLNRSSESLQQLGSCCVALYDSEAIYTSYAKRLRPISSMTAPSFMAGYFQSRIYRQEVMDATPVYTTRANLNNRGLARIFIYYPPMERQIKIGLVIQELFITLNYCEDPEHRMILNTFTSLFIEHAISHPVLLFLSAQGKG